VGRKLPDDFGLFDMHGNVWTWGQKGAGKDPVNVAGRPAEDIEHRTDIYNGYDRLLRGSSFLNRASSVRCDYRFEDRPAVRIVRVGVRPAGTCD
jgi:formylglycine-generating enzyme required for sulfatase activity